MSLYTIEVEVRDDLRVGAPGLQGMADIVAEGLERRGYRDGDYEVRVEGPPELRIRMVPR